MRGTRALAVTILGCAAIGGCGTNSDAGDAAADELLVCAGSTDADAVEQLFNLVQVPRTDGRGVDLIPELDAVGRGQGGIVLTMKSGVTQRQLDALKARLERDGPPGLAVKTPPAECS
jgi:hypothetical protein